MRAKKKATPKSSPQNSHINIITKAAQRRRIADLLLLQGSATTLELQSKCNALHGVRRVFELRHDFGWKIETQWQCGDDPQGRPHRVGNYVLLEAGRLP